jgi:hypothetical protein
VFDTNKDTGSKNTEEIIPVSPAKSIATVEKIPVNTTTPVSTVDVSDWWGTIKSTPAGVQ